MIDPPLSLRRGADLAIVDPLGGRPTRYCVDGQEVVAGDERPDLFAYRGSLLAPWPNRVTDGRWSWCGEQLQLPHNDPTGPAAALHGLVIHAAFRITSQTETSVSLLHQLEPSPGYPFPLQVGVSYELDATGLACSLTATNTGRCPAPVGLGAHPYIAAPDLVDDLVLTLPATTLLVTDEQWRETGRRPVGEAGLDFRTGRRLGAVEIDAAFTGLTRDPNGQVEALLGLADGAEVVLSSGDTCRWLVVYTGHTLPRSDRRRSIAVEPMTCGPNALATGDVDVVLPGASLSLDWRLMLRR